MKIALIGYGKMGKAIETLALQQGHSIVLKINSKNPEMLQKEYLQEADVAIEFSGPASAFDQVRKCLEAGVPVVCGSTGWLQHWEEAVSICRKHQNAFIWASNFSVGVNLFFQLNKYLAQLMNAHAEYNVQLEEIHHTEKKDAPSGTAITLAEQVIGMLDHKTGWKKDHADTAQEVAILSKRIAGVPGTHEVLYESAVDSITIKHTAYSREGFALGALLAAAFIKDKTGIFTMNDVLNF